MKTKTRLIIISLLAVAILALAAALARRTTNLSASNVEATSTPSALTVAPTTQANTRPEQTFVLRMSKANYDRLQNIEPVSVFSNEGVVWLEVTAADYQELQKNYSADAPYQLLGDEYFLKFYDYQFDPLFQEPALPPELVSVYAPGSPGLYIVQWHGDSVQDEWGDTLNSMGVILLGTRNLARMTPEQADEVRKLDFVRWVGIYHAAYRVRPDLFESKEAVQNMGLEVYDDGLANGSVDRVIEAVEMFGGNLIDDYREFTERSSTTTLVVDLPTRALTAMAQLEEVILIDYGSPTDILEDEMSGFHRN